MGRIYTYPEIAEGRVPQKSDFEVAKLLLLQRLEGFAREGEIYGAKVYGSVARGTASERSDLDLLVVIEDGVELSPFKSLFDRIYDQTSVQVEPQLVEKRFAQRGFHAIDITFLNHIALITEGENIVGQNPVEIIKPTDSTIAQEHQRYLAKKLRSFQEGFLGRSHEDRYHSLQRALEAPVNVGRRVLQTLASVGLSIDLSSDDSKENVVRMFRGVFGDSALAVGFESLLADDRLYSGYLRSVLEGSVTREDYESTLDTFMRDSLPQAIRWTSEMSYFYSEVLESGLSSVEGARSSSRRESL